MTDHRRDEQDDNQSRQQPDWTDDEIARQRQIDCAHRQKCEQRLPARFRFIDVLGLIGHRVGIAKITSDASAAAVAASLSLPRRSRAKAGRGVFDALEARRSRRRGTVATAPDRDITLLIDLKTANRLS